jgi:N-methylhydantoinase B
VLRPLTVRAPEGSFFNPDRTAAAGARAIVSQHITDLGVGALAEVVPERLYAASSHVANPVMSGIGSGTGDRFVLFDAVIGGTGALATKDGEEGLCSSVNVTNIPVERHEINYPVRIDRLAFLPDSGGPGRHRGGTGVRKEYTMLTDDIEVTILMNRNRTSPWGLADGEAGRRARALIESSGESREVHSTGHYDLDSDETLAVELSGSGGFGDPTERDPAAVREDVRKGYVTPEGARKDYRVAIEVEDGDPVVDEETTERMR